jgi:CheY-like chemotaxis protein
MQKKVLIVDDDIRNRKLIRVILENNGYTTFEAGDGREAIAILKKEKPDLILMDLMMPEMSGEEAIKAIRAMPEFKETPVVVLSATALAEEIERIRSEVEINGYITKPIKLDNFINTIKEYLK